MAPKKLEFTPESGNVDTYGIDIIRVLTLLQQTHLWGGALAEWVRALTWTGDRVVLAVSESRCGNFASDLWEFHIPCFANCLSESKKAVGPFYLVSMPGEVKDPTSLHWKCVTFVDSTTHSKLPPSS